MVVCVFDIGGTKTRAGLFDTSRSALLSAASAATPNHLERPGRSFEQLRNELLDVLAELSARLLPPERIEHVSIAFAGPVDAAGNVLAAPTVWGTRFEGPYTLARDLRRVWPTARVRILNDVTAAGYRYLEPTRRDLAVVTVSSGIGHKVFLDGKVALGPSARGGEIGHLRVDDSPRAAPCECGGRGHLGAIASGRGVLDRARRETGRPHLTNPELVAAFHAREPWAVAAVQHGAEALSLGLSAMHLAIGLERFVLIGGFALALGAPYRRLVAEAARSRCWNGAGGDWDHWVELGAEDDDSGLIGAGLAYESGGRTMKVTRYNYAHQLGDDVQPLVDEIRKMLVEGRYELTAEVKQFEAELAAYLGASHVRGVNTGTDALIASLRALGVGPGDEVITQANTFHATVAAIDLVGATPVLVDADPESFLMDQAQLPGVITRRTRALIPVHLYGKPTPMAELMALAEARGLFVVEDAAQAIGARTGGQCVSTFGHFGCFSFHPSKNLCAAGDGGAVVARNTQLDEALRRQRELGQVGQNNHLAVGLNSKLDGIQARILSWKLPRLERWNEHRRRCAALYRERLADLPLGFQATTEGEVHVYHLFQVRTPRRDAFLAHLREHGVDATVRYPTPIHLQPAFARHGWKQGQFPVAERLAQELLTLPIRPDLSVAEIDYVSDCAHAFFREEIA